MRLRIYDEEINVVIDALDFYSRIWIGQYRNILFESRGLKKCGQLEKYENEIVSRLMFLRRILLPGLEGYGFSGSYGIFSDERDIRAGIAYDLQQEIRNKRAYFEHPQGGYTVDFHDPLPCDDDPCPFPRAYCRTEDGKTALYVDAVDRQVQIILDSLYVQKAFVAGRFCEMFSFFTDDRPALSIVDEIEEIYSKIPDRDCVMIRSVQIDSVIDSIKSQLDHDDAA
ncbi:MAG: hypothetical protein IKP14_01915 [Clostridiales bacterium]|nr:hypothetical protein [Clostridiales bacterium]